MERHYEHNTEGRTCTRRITFDYVDGKLHNVKFIGGCPGNTRGLSALLEGMEAGEVVEKLSGIHCRGINSCPDELAAAVRKVMTQTDA